MTQILNEQGIVIVKESTSNYQLSYDQNELSWNRNLIIDLHGSTIMSFKPKEEMFWDMKLVLNKKVSIGSCIVEPDKYSVYIQGIYNQKIFFGEDHLVSIHKSVLSLETNFKIKKIEHLALLLILAIYNDRKE